MTPIMETADVVIIGGGIVGSSIAWNLTEQGCREVLIVERETHQGKGSTGKSMGGVRAQFATAPNIQMSMYSIQFYSEFDQRLGQPGGYRPRGYLFVATIPAHLEYLRANQILQYSLGLKQALGDPWADISQRFQVGSAVEGPVTNLTKFGAFVQLSEGIEGMVHVSDISAEKRINQPQDVLRVGQIVKAQVLAIDLEKRQMRLGMKQRVPTGLDEYIAEHNEGDMVTGRLMDESGGQAKVELGEGIHATCKVSAAAAPAKTESPKESKADLSSLSSMLQARWKSGSGGPPKAEPLRAGQVRSFRIVTLDRAAKKIGLEFA